MRHRQDCTSEASLASLSLSEEPPLGDYSRPTFRTSSRYGAHQTWRAKINFKFLQWHASPQAAMQINACLFPLSLYSAFGHTQHLGDLAKGKSAKKLQVDNLT
jgi:hypothetical protein